MLLLAGYGIAGYVMAGAVQGPGYRTAAWIYLAVFGVSVCGLVLLLARGRQRKDGPRQVI